jgi:organic radical activating enzyme|tara:strand:+ start:372 stop:1538 length:1167 start_codon:yes stop_codon:yes gene_type:complete
MPINKNTFCVAPWYSIFVNADKKLAPCCKFKKHDYNYNDIKQYFNSKELNKVRQDLLDGIKNENCSKCWSDEDKGGDSLRLISNRTVARGTNTRLLDQIEDPRLSNLKSFDLVLGNLCNLKCVMCTPKLSSQLLAEASLNPELKAIHGKDYKQKDFDWPKSDDFVDWCNRYLPEAIHIKFTGGEPFIIPWIQTVLDKIPDEQKKKCVLHFTTNLTIVNLGLFENFRKFKEVWLSVSAEGINETHEYLRYGHKWETLETNIRLIQEMNIPNLILKINHVVQTASYHSIIPMTEHFDREQLEIHPIMCTDPKHFHISSLTKSSKEKFLKDTQNYTGFNKQFIQYVRNASQENIEQDMGLVKDCITHLSAFDKVRKNSHKEIIPVANLHHV